MSLKTYTISCHQPTCLLSSYNSCSSGNEITIHSLHVPLLIFLSIPMSFFFCHQAMLRDRARDISRLVEKMPCTIKITYV